MSETYGFASHLATQAELQLGVKVKPSTLDDVLKLHLNPGPLLEKGAEHLIETVKGEGFTWDINTIFVLLAKVRELETEVGELRDRLGS